MLTKTWYKLRRALSDARTSAIYRGKPHWTSAFSQIEAWITRRTASIAASEPGSEFSSIADSEGDFFTVKQVFGTEGSVVGDFESLGVNPKMADSTSTAMPSMSAAMPAQDAAMPQIKGTIETMETSKVPVVELPQATSSVAGSAWGVFFHNRLSPNHNISWLSRKWHTLPCLVRPCRTLLWPGRGRRINLWGWGPRFTPRGS